LKETSQPYLEYVSHLEETSQPLATPLLGQVSFSELYKKPGALGLAQVGYDLFTSLHQR